METENLTQYTRPQLAFSNRLRTVKVRRALLKNNLRPSPYAIFPISIHVFRLKRLQQEVASEQKNFLQGDLLDKEYVKTTLAGIFSRSR